MVTKKSVTAKPKSEAAAPKKASTGKSVEKDMGAGAAMAARSKDAAAAKRTTKASSAKMDSAKPAEGSRGQEGENSSNESRFRQALACQAGYPQGQVGRRRRRVTRRRCGWQELGRVCAQRPAKAAQGSHRMRVTASREC